VAQKKPNAWGLYDMHGNVKEWCADWLGSYPTGTSVDPQGAASGVHRVARGGDWSTDSTDWRLQCANRDGGNRAYWAYGFRCAMTLPSGIRGIGGHP